MTYYLLLGRGLTLPLFSVHMSRVLLEYAYLGPPGVLGIWGEWLFIFRDLGSTGNYFKGAGEQAQILGDLGSPAKKQKKK